jgi:ABC-type transport system involved in multi-copper enzyme maturation permease subunit
MLLSTIKKEIINNVLSFRFIITYALLFVLVLLAIFLMTNVYGDRAQEYRTGVAEAREQIDKIAAIDDPSKQFEEFQRSILYGARQPSSMSILARGVDANLPTQVSTRGGWFGGASEDRLGRNTLFEIFQTPDFVYVVNIVMSLLALLFVFDAVCGEKEQGTLKLVLANSVPRDTVLFGKWIGGYISVAAPFTVAVMGGFVYIYITGALEGSEDALTRFGLLFGLSLLYISAFFTLGLMISTLTHRTSTALLVALLIWICWILVVPNLAPIAARLLTPVPSQQVIDAEKQAIERESQVLLESIQKRKVYGDRDEFERIREDAEKRQNKLDKFFRDKLKAQIGLTQNLARISPSASYLFASTRLAGTGPDLFATFQKAHERFQQSQQEYQNDLFRSDKIEWDRSGPKANDPEWFRADDLPRFEMKAERLNDSFNAALFDILLLVIYNVIFFMLSYVFFLRYDVT